MEFHVRFFAFFDAINDILFGYQNLEEGLQEAGRPRRWVFTIRNQVGLDIVIHLVRHRHCPMDMIPGVEVHVVEQFLGLVDDRRGWSILEAPHKFI